MEINIKGHTVLFDEDDLPVIQAMKWRIQPKRKYVMSFVRKKGNSTSVYLHRILLGVNERHVLVDHKNNNPLDNRRDNLRITDYKGNARNTSSRGKSKFLGVSIYNDSNGYRKICARIYVDGKNKYLGCFKDELSAAIAYNNAAKVHFGEFANFNEV